jgi:hypothetical protein
MGRLIFVVYPSIEVGKRSMPDFSGSGRAAPRSGHVKITQLVNTPLPAGRRPNR